MMVDGRNNLKWSELVGIDSLENFFHPFKSIHFCHTVSNSNLQMFQEPSIPPSDQQQRKYVFVDLCSGSGSLSTGAAWAGFHKIYSVDTDPKQPHITHRISVLDKFAMERLGALLEKLRGEGWLIAMHASPPCQQFSQAGAKSRSQKTDEENAENMRKAIEIVNAVLDFMHKHADVWSLENPGTGSLWTEHIGKIKHDLSRRLVLDICQYGALMKKNMIIALSCSEIRDRFGEQRQCPGKMTCDSVHPNPGNGFSSRRHVSLNDVPLSERIAFPKQLSLHLTSTMLTYLRSLPDPPLPSRRNLPPTKLVGLARIDCFYSNNTSPSAQLTGTAKRHIQSLWNNTSPLEMQQLVKLSWEFVQEHDSTLRWCSDTHISLALEQLQLGTVAQVEGGSFL